MSHKSKKKKVTQNVVNKSKQKEITETKDEEEDNCSICLDPYTDKAVVGTCFHSFCFLCIKEWANQNAVCPLCKKSFDRVVHNIISDLDYEEYILCNREITHSEEYLRYVTDPRLNYTGIIPAVVYYDNVSMPIRPLDGPPQETTCLRRRFYREYIFSPSMSDYIGDTAEEYRSIASSADRVHPWLHREVRVIVAPAQAERTYELIIACLRVHDIRSDPFHILIEPHLGPYVDHFIHELYTFFASSSYMHEYDRATAYLLDLARDYVTINNRRRRSPSAVVLFTRPSRPSRPAQAPVSQAGPSGVQPPAHDSTIIIGSSSESETSDCEVVNIITTKRKRRIAMDWSSSADDIDTSEDESESSETQSSDIESETSETSSCLSISSDSSPSETDLPRSLPFNPPPRERSRRKRRRCV